MELIYKKGISFEFSSGYSWEEMWSAFMYQFIGYLQITCTIADRNLSEYLWMKRDFIFCHYYVYTLYIIIFFLVNYVFIKWALLQKYYARM